MNILFERIELVDDLKPRFFTEMVHAADIDQKVKADFVPAGAADRLDFLKRHLQRDLVAKFRLRQIRKTLLDFSRELRCGHETASNNARFWSSMACSCMILCCSFIRPSNNA